MNALFAFLASPAGRVVRAVAGLALILIGLLAFVQIMTGQANLGIDFAGGSAVQVKFEQSVPLADVRSVLVGGGLEGLFRAVAVGALLASAIGVVSLLVRRCRR